MNRDTKLIAILRRQYRIILTALGENIFVVLGSVASRLRPIRNILVGRKYIESMEEILKYDHSNEAVTQCFPALLFIILHKVGLTFPSVIKGPLS